MHLLEDLRDAYAGTLEETILTEIVANALDSGARRLELRTDSAAGTLTATDDGAGMTRGELSRYHDLATSTKRRGSGIGFAGVGIKLGLLACDEVITETKRGRHHLATSWRLAQRRRAPWSWIEPPHLLEADGTAVLLRLSNALSQLLDPGFVEAMVLRQFQPLFEPDFLDILASAYPAGFTVVINDRVIVGPIRDAARYPIEIRIGRQRKASGVGYLSRHDEALPEPERGLAISTRGKVIRRGWDWIGITPAEPDRVEGLIEVPALAEALTLNKGDFLRHGQRGALFLSYRKSIQEAVSARFSAWGAAAPAAKRAPRTRPLERDLRRILGDLAGEYPLLSTLVERHAGGQRRLALGEELHVTPVGTTAAEDVGDADAAGSETAPGEGDSRTEDGAGDGSAVPAPDAAQGKRDSRAAPVQLPSKRGRKRPATLSLRIQFESLPNELALGRLIESTVWVNDAHPAFRRAVASRAEGYHIALTVAAALAPLTAEPARTQEFVNAFLARWGEAGTTNGKR
jgi:hypothetical protein